MQALHSNESNLFAFKSNYSEMTCCEVFIILILCLLFGFRYEHVDMSIAVATDNGLITPIVTQADSRVSPKP